MRRAAFLDRDGVLIEEGHLLTRPEHVRLTPRAAEAVRTLKDAGFAVVVVSNQPVVARGMATEADVEAVNRHINEKLRCGADAEVDAFYFCPHHPNADLENYRVDCECRKPRPGMLLCAADELGLDLRLSYMVGDRITDIMAGARAGCRTVLVTSGAHAEAPIETPEPLDVSIRPDHTCENLYAAAGHIRGSAS